MEADLMIKSLLSLFRTKKEGAWRIDGLEQILRQEIAAAIERHEINVDDIERVAGQVMEDTFSDTAQSVLTSLKSAAPKMITSHERLEIGFQKRTYKRWKSGIDLLKMIVVISQEAGGAFNETYRPKAVEANDARFEAIVNLHARSLLVSGEILHLLKGGFPDAALGRWRTLHEFAVIARFLQHNEKSVSERYILHRNVMAHKAIRQYREHQDRANLTPFSEEEEIEAKRLADNVIDSYGREMRGDYGWAAQALSPEPANFGNIEKSLELDHWRPRYKWACQDIHGAYRPPLTSLGTSESREAGLLIGASNSGFTDPAHMTAISLNIANNALLQIEPNFDRLLILQILQKLSDEVGDTFLRIDRETAPSHKKSENEEIDRLNEQYRVAK